MSVPDWRRSEEILFQKGKEAILRFADEHPDEVCSFFAIYSDFCYGDVAFMFDTLDNSLLQAKRHEEYLVKRWRQSFGDDCQPRDPQFFRPAWELAYTSFSSPLRSTERIHDYNAFGSFKYEGYLAVDFADWRAYFESDEFMAMDSEDEPRKPDPFAGNVILLIWKVIERLLNEGILQRLTISSPFRVGFQFHDAELAVLRILNWPPHKGPRVLHRVIPNHGQPASLLTKGARGHEDGDTTQDRTGRIAGVAGAANVTGG
jgi:hypothetical protein